MDLVNIAKRARKASHILATASTEVKDNALRQLVLELRLQQPVIQVANEKDIADAEANSVDYALKKRLSLKGDKFETLMTGIDEIANKVSDPIGKLSLATRLDTGLDLYRVACPIGVLCIIFESRPDAAVQIAALALKSANALILKGGKEAKYSNQILVDIIRDALPRAGLPADSIQLVSTREEVQQLLALDEYIDLVIPRGSNQLVKYIMKNTSIPVLGHADGICSVYIDKAADLYKAVKVVVDAKTQYPAVCNAAETLLVHRDAVQSLLPPIADALAAKGVVMHADETCLQHIMNKDFVKPMKKDAFKAEYLQLEMTVAVVDSLDQAVEHINTYGSHHTDCILTEDMDAAEAFLRKVDSAGVFHNCSTRFADGFRYGFGAEIGVSTNRIHARGPVGLEGLVIYKYRMHGNGHCVSEYGPGKKAYRHERIPYEENDQAPRLNQS